jgi:hypothetical protein
MQGMDVTGHGHTACARHGCFAPGSGVDFHKGERQMNIDWSLSQAMKTTNMKGILRLLDIYDIMCRYGVNLDLRFTLNEYLEMDPDLEIMQAIGLFHVHGHEESCLYRFATSYIPGVGSVDGEILETLWAPLNQIFKSMRTASLAHRTEVIDDHERDSNWKKIIHIGRSILLIQWHQTYLN